MSTLRQLMYSSRMRGPATAGELAILLAQARRNNAALGVTGVLVVVDDVFVQILEGDAAVLGALLQRIAQDPRHEALTIILEHDVDTRSFASWSMASVSASPRQFADWAALEDAVGIDAVLRELGSRPGQLPALAQRILAAMAEP